MNDILEKCKKTRILAAIGIVGLFLGTIMPYVKYSLGFYCLWIGVLCLIAYAILHKKEEVR